MDDKRYPYIKYAWGGVSCERVNGSLTGCRSLLEAVRDYGTNDCVVVIAPDERGPMARAWIASALHGPMLDLALPVTDVRTLDRSGFVLRALSTADHSYGVLARKALADPEWQGLNTVGLSHHLDNLRRAGARIGHREGSHIVWEDATPPTPVPVEGEEAWESWRHTEWELIPHQPINHPNSEV